MAIILIVIAILFFITEISALLTFMFRITNDLTKYGDHISKCSLNNSDPSIMNNYTDWRCSKMITTVPLSVLFSYYIDNSLVLRFSKLHNVIRTRFKQLRSQADRRRNDAVSDTMEDE